MRPACVCDFAVPDPMVGVELTREKLIRLERESPGFAGPMFRFVLVH